MGDIFVILFEASWLIFLQDRQNRFETAKIIILIQTKLQNEPIFHFSHQSYEKMRKKLISFFQVKFSDQKSDIFPFLAVKFERRCIFAL